MQKTVNPTFDHDSYWPVPDEPYEISHEESRAVSLFFARSYFSRIWVIQEVAAANKVIAYCGAHVLFWEDLLRASFHIFRHRWNTRLVRKGLSEVLGVDATIFAFALQPYKVNRMAVRSFNDEMHLDYVLYLAWNSESTEPRDKVFATLGLVGIAARKRWELSNGDNAEQELQEILQKIRQLVDYRKSLAQVYIDAAHFAIEYPTTPENSLMVLTNKCGQFGTDIPNLPSWVPNWTKLPTNSLTGLAFGPKHNAAGGRLHRLRQLSSHSRILLVEGLLFDTVKAISSTVTESSTMTRGQLEWFKMATLISTPYSTAESTSDVLWRTLCNNLAQGRIPAPASLGATFRNWCLLGAKYWIANNELQEYHVLLR
jgi:hypothetical protein